MILFWLSIITNAFIGYDLTVFQIMFLLIYSLYCVVKKNKKAENQLLLAIPAFFIYLIGINIFFYIPFTIINCCISYYLYKRLELYQPPFNKNNLCVAFYRGNNNTYKGRFTSLLGLDVTSVDLYYRGCIYRYKKGKLIKQKTRNLDDYLLIDTRKSGIIRKLNKLMKLKYETKFYKSNCVEILKPMLKELNLEPKGYLDSIPSNYARSVLSARK